MIMAHRHILLLAAFILLGVSPQVNAAPPDAIFNCDKVPEVCANMCWATRCASPKFPMILTYDKPSATVERARRNSAGCGSKNKCVKGGKGIGRRGGIYDSCDEYPFAKTRQSTYPNGKQVSRCVPLAQNRSQGGTISTAVQRMQKAGKKIPFNMRIGFGNPGVKAAKWCNQQACKNDGWQVQAGKISKREEEPQFRYWKTASGMVIATTYDIEPMSNFTREADDVPTGARLGSAGLLDTWTEDVEIEGEVPVPVTFISDVVEGEMTPEEISEYLASASADDGNDEGETEAEGDWDQGDWDEEAEGPADDEVEAGKA
jgi:hypothetical protein